MEYEAGDDYVRHVAQFIRKHEQNLAEGGFGRKRRIPRRQETSSVFNPLTWLGLDSAQVNQGIKPIVFSLDPHHLFYLLMRLEALEFSVGPLDVKLDNPSRPTTYINFAPPPDSSDTLSLASIRSSLSAVSNLSLGPGWWGRAAPPTLDSELKYIYSSFTKLPALSIHAPRPKLITEIADESLHDCAIPLDSFKNLQCLQCADVDPRILLGWDKVAESLRSLTIKRGGLEDVTDVFVNLVADDESRRKGQTTSTRQKRVTRGPSFHSTRLPPTVLEDLEENSSAADDKPDAGSPQSWKWAFLRHLCLSDNSLTFFPTDPLPYLTSLTHLDLSSNLLISVPPGLSALYNLVSLNLSDNMIDSVLGIYQRLGQVLYLNISHNRLESICGLERLPALERVDLRHNFVEESAEVGRLAVLPNIVEVWIEGNPLMEREESPRISCFSLFWKEGKTITLDGTPPSFYEKRFLPESVTERPNSSNPISTVYSPSATAVGNARIDDLHKESPQLTSTPSPSLSANTSPGMGPAGQRGRGKRIKRIVDLDGGETSDQARARSRSASRREVDKLDATKDAVTLAELAPRPGLTTEPSTNTPTVVQPRRIFRHTRHQTEANVSVDNTNNIPTSATMGSLPRYRSAARRARSTTLEYGKELDAENARVQQNEADAYRARIEALRADMGDGWLKVLNQSAFGSPSVKS